MHMVDIQSNTMEIKKEFGISTRPKLPKNLAEFEMNYVKIRRSINIYHT